MTYKELLDYLYSIRDNKHAEFAGHLSNSCYITIGVKNPVLRGIIKEHVLDNELKLDEFVLSKHLEIDFIYFGIGLKRCKTLKNN